MMDICEVRDECPDGTSSVVMEDCVNKNLDETHREIYEYDEETNRDTIRTVIEELPDGRNCNERKHI